MLLTRLHAGARSHGQGSSGKGGAATAARKKPCKKRARNGNCRVKNLLQLQQTLPSSCGQGKAESTAASSRI